MVVALLIRGFFHFYRTVGSGDLCLHHARLTRRDLHDCFRSGLERAWAALIVLRDAFMRFVARLRLEGRDVVRLMLRGSFYPICRYFILLEAERGVFRSA